MPSHRPLILISNDDGVAAPGLLALVAVLLQEDICDFSVCGPSGERSAQSHSINIHKPLHAFPINIPGAKEAWAVDGTPADSVMLALYGSLLKVGGGGVCREREGSSPGRGNGREDYVRAGKGMEAVLAWTRSSALGSRRSPERRRVGAPRRGFRAVPAQDWEP